MTSLVVRLIVDDEGQDLVEYILLTAVVGLSTIVAINLIDDVMRLTYESWDASTQAIWEPQDP
jgi:hypothetical protein